MNRKWVWLMCSIPCLAYGFQNQCDIPHVLLKMRRGAAWTMTGNSYKGLKWLDKTQKKPSEIEIQKAEQQCVVDVKSRDALKAQARLDLKDPTTTTDKKVQDLIVLLDFDK